MRPIVARRARRAAQIALLAVSATGCGSRRVSTEAAPAAPEPAAPEPSADESSADDPDTAEAAPVGPRIDELAVPDDPARLVPIDQVCLPSEDGVCPPSCTRDNDADCCVSDLHAGPGLCYYDKTAGCTCAVIGPLNPPETSASRAEWLRGHLLLDPGR